MLLTISDWLQSTWLSHAFISQGRWAWPMCESLHFMGLCLLSRLCWPGRFAHARHGKGYPGSSPAQTGPFWGGWLSG